MFLLAGNMLDYGEMVFVDELNNGHHEYFTGKSVRVCGRLDHHNFQECKATLTDPQTSAAVTLDTSLVEPFESRLSSLFQVIGEIDFCDNTPVLRVRVIRCIDGMDLILYRKVVSAQRDYLKSRTGT